MLEFKDFYNIAEYGNEMWKGCFTPKEVACNAYDYYVDFEASKENGKPTRIIQELAKLLVEDGSEECKDWLYDMAKELGLIDMDYMDYIETDEDIVVRFMAEPKTEESKSAIAGIIYKHGENDYDLWEGFVLSEEDENAIQAILSKYETEGGSVRGTRKEIAKEMEN